MKFAVHCRFCKAELGSQRSLGEAMEELRSHIELRHPNPETD